MAKSNEKKTTVVWQLSNDGLRPTESPWGFVVRNPLVRSIPPGAKIQISLNVASDTPMLAWPVRSHQDDLSCPQLILPGQDIVVTLENKSQHMALIVEDKEALLNIHPLLSDARGEVG